MHSHLKGNLLGLAGRLSSVDPVDERCIAAGADRNQCYSAETDRRNHARDTTQDRHDR